MLTFFDQLLPPKCTVLIYSTSHSTQCGKTEHFKQTVDAIFDMYDIQGKNKRIVYVVTSNQTSFYFYQKDCIS